MLIFFWPISVVFSVFIETVLHGYLLTSNTYIFAYKTNTNLNELCAGGKLKYNFNEKPFETSWCERLTPVTI